VTPVRPGDGASNPTTVVRSEEQLLVGTRWVARERVTIRRRIVSETRQLTVTVRREELVVDRTPLAGAEDDARRAVPQMPLVVVLHEEVPVVELHTRPYEQVTVTVDRIAGSETVTAALASERFGLDPDLPPSESAPR
jgi:uncharacterized protein (TIGR02271 family)